MYKLVIQLIVIHVTSVCTGFVSFYPLTLGGIRQSVRPCYLLLIYPNTTVDTNSVIALQVFFCHTYGTNVNSKLRHEKAGIDPSLPKPNIVMFWKSGDHVYLRVLIFNHVVGVTSLVFLPDVTPVTCQSRSRGCVLMKLFCESS